MAEDKEMWDKIYKSVLKNEKPFLVVDKQIHHETYLTSNRSSYIERNYQMIDASDICIFYYNEKYLPPRRRYAKKDFLSYQPQSGTKLAFEYAKRKKKIIINLLNS